MSGWSIWSWDAPHSMWLEVADSVPKRQAEEILKRRNLAAARLMPDARFTMTPTGKPPTEAPA